jgi:hypothetical protein
MFCVPIKTDVLTRIPLFAGLAEPEIQALGSRAIERKFEAGEMLFWEGEPCKGMFLIVQGTVKIFKTSASGREMMLSLEPAPCTVAELPLFDGGPYPASVRAEEATVAYFVNKTDFQNVCRQYPDVALKVLAVVGTRLRDTAAGEGPARSGGAGAVGRFRLSPYPSGACLTARHRARGGLAKPGTLPGGGIAAHTRPAIDHTRPPGSGARGRAAGVILAAL